MCNDFEYELDWKLKCERCGKKPAVDLNNPLSEDDLFDYKSLCEKCGIEVYSKDIVADWAGTDLYLKKYPDMVEVWR
ncbi:hypothetical protein LCGC14_1453970 [marine sediment metagenome]|uniref:Uncharacterized protein n=1 Tax=marine sediment metagenome TaxID=412755 RepID=A0A0F9JHQ7_9ZZZZ